MSQSTVSHYSCRNLDACTLQLNGWKPFVNLSFSDGITDFHQTAVSAAAKDSLLPASKSIDVESVCARAPDFSVSPHVKCSLKKVMSKRAAGGGKFFGWSCKSCNETPFNLDGNNSNLQDDVVFKYDECDSMDITSNVDLAPQNQHIVLKICDDPLHVNLSKGLPDSDTDLRFFHKEVSDTPCQNNHKSLKGVHVIRELSANAGMNNSSGCYTELDCSFMPHSVTDTSIGSWSKRQKQLSKALVRGLWRRNENVQLRKRRRKSGSSRSSSGPSSESPVNASAAYATCSDFPIQATDSSGELFFHGEGGDINWETDTGFIGEGLVQRIDGVDVMENLNFESGHGRETGYTGDGELECGDDSLGLGPWSDSTGIKLPSMYRIAIQMDQDVGEHISFHQLTFQDTSLEKKYAILLQIARHRCDVHM
ncbi:hypothetical protein KP509_27G036600 [Ceratopteris richardii]|uniref:Uncharacterized protein n=1 Tax=Ceratopteris richardii TaxID=49495 RepID=A0A8T2RHA3_CERRI|nr:hypothetical protein KP509_27G036600 [Ceratopteris richardii]